MPPALYKLDPTLNLKKDVLLHTGGNLFYAIQSHNLIVYDEV